MAKRRGLYFHEHCIKIEALQLHLFNLKRAGRDKGVANPCFVHCCAASHNGPPKRLRLNYDAGAGSLGFSLKAAS